MSLYDKINKKVEVTAPSPGYLGNAPADFVEPVMAEVPVEAGGKVYPVTDARELQTPAPVVPAQEKRFLSWWESPNYVKAVEAQAEAGKQRMEVEQKRANRARNLAVLGDLANLAMQSKAVRNGVTKIEKFTPQTYIANEKLAALRDKHAAEINLYAQRMREAQDLERRERNNYTAMAEKHKREDAAAKAKADKEAYDRAWEQYKQGKTEEYREKQLAQAKARETRLASQGRKSSTYVVDDVEYDDIYEAYAALPKSARKKKTDSYGKTTGEEDTNVRVDEMKYLVAKYNSEGKSRGWIDEDQDIDEDFK